MNRPSPPSLSKFLASLTSPHHPWLQSRHLVAQSFAPSLICVRDRLREKPQRAAQPKRIIILALWPSSTAAVTISPHLAMQHATQRSTQAERTHFVPNATRHSHGRTTWSSIAEHTRRVENLQNRDPTQQNVREPLQRDLSRSQFKQALPGAKGTLPHQRVFFLLAALSPWIRARAGNSSHLPPSVHTMSRAFPTTTDLLAPAQDWIRWRLLRRVSQYVGYLATIESTLLDVFACISGFLLILM